MEKRHITRSSAPASVGLVKEIRSELKADIRSLGKRMDARFAGIESKIEGLTGEIHRVASLMEEQRNENRIVLDGLAAVISRQERVESDVERINKQIRLL